MNDAQQGMLDAAWDTYSSNGQMIYGGFRIAVRELLEAGIQNAKNPEPKPVYEGALSAASKFHGQGK